MHKHRTDGEDAIKKSNKQFLKRFLKSISNEELILDIDASFIDAHKNRAKYSYKGTLGYMSMISHINGGYVIDVDFREGNKVSVNENLEFIKQCQLYKRDGIIKIIGEIK